MPSDKKQLYKYKGFVCAVCGMSVKKMIEKFGTFHRMFELHHIDPKKKEKNYNNLIKQNISTKQIDEVDKCILLCRNCHGVVHAQDIKVNGQINYQYGERKVSQEVSGWMVIDKEENKINFLCEEVLLIEPYIETLGKNKSEIVFGMDLYKTNKFVEKLKLLEENETYRLHSAESEKLLFQAKKEGDSIKLQWNIGFRLIEMDGSDLEPGERFWYRNGMVLYEDGNVKTDGSINYELAQSKLP